MVTVHRVGSDSSGAVDSARTDAAGRYTVRYRRFGGDDAIYFAAAMYRSVAYFSAPLRGAHIVGDEGEITVYDTTSRPVELHVRGHHVVVGAARPDGMHDIVEVWELSNDTTVTVVGRDSLAAIWTTPLPRGATRFAGGSGDVSSGALSARGDTVLMSAAFGPGVKQVSYTYALPSSSFPLELPIDRRTSVLEVLVEDPMGQVTGAALAPTAAAAPQGRVFKRYLAQDVPAGERVLIRVSATTSVAARTNTLIAVAGVLVVSMVAALLLALRRNQADRVRLFDAPARREVLLASIAALDARHERADPEFSADAYAAERALLKSQLAAALAAEQRAP